MSVAKVVASHLHGQLGAHHRSMDGQNRKSLMQAVPGEEVSLRVLNKIADQRFVAAMGDSRYVVDSAVPLHAGEIVKATVSSVGGIVELKYLGVGQFEQIGSETTSEQLDTNLPGGAALTDLQNKYRVTLPLPIQKFVAEISNAVQRPETMAMGALYLSRFGESMQLDALHALYAKQMWNENKTTTSGETADISALILGVQQGNSANLNTLTKLLGDTIDQSVTSAPASQGDGSLANLCLATSGQLAEFTKQGSDANEDTADDSLHELARHLLNLQNDGAVAYHYGSLPVIVANQLVELDLVLFRERESVSRPQGMRKLVMTLRTETLGKVEIVAQSLDAQLNVSIAAQSPDSTNSLAGHAGEVRELLARLGWNVEGVAYRLTSQTPRAAEQIVKHVLNAGCLDAII